MGSIHWERLAAKLFCIGIGIAVVLLAGRYILPVLLPFAVAYLLAQAVQPLAQKLQAHLHIPKKAAAPILLCLLLVGTVWLTGACVQRLMTELSHLAERLLSPGGGLGEMGTDALFDALQARLAFLRREGEGLEVFRARFEEVVSRLTDGLLKTLTEALPAVAGRIISALPAVFLSVIITVIAGFYFCMEDGGLLRSAVEWLPLGVRDRLPAWRARLRGFAKGYLRAYLLLLLLTFSELFLGFCILRVEYAFLAAVLVALVDLLPILGVGTVLIPWSVLAFLQKDAAMGVGLLILFSSVSILRQIIEPKLLSRQLGLHPLLTLFAGYAGFSLFGILGMLLFPPLFTLVKGLAVGRRSKKEQSPL